MRVMAFVVMLALNSSLLIFFTKALRYSNTSIEATITSTAASFLFTVRYNYNNSNLIIIV